MKKANDIKKKIPEYEKPVLKKIGSLRDLSQTASHGGKTDGGAFPSNKHMCITLPAAIEEHRILLADTTCQSAYLSEIASVVKPGDVVCDLGVGSGIHTMFAVAAGASKVYAIDIDPLIFSAQEVINENGLSDRVVFIKGNSRDIELPEKVDVLISNVGFLHTLNDVPDAAVRFLKPTGRILPEAVSISFVPVRAVDIYKKHIESWNENLYGFHFSAFKNMASHHPIYWDMLPDQIISQPYTSALMSLRHILPKVHSWTAEFRISSQSVCCGVGGWYGFNSRGLEFISTRPPLKMSKDLWNNFFLPFPKPIDLAVGDTLKVNIEMQREVLGESPVWIWNTEYNGNALYSQSSLKGMAIDFVPTE